MCPISPTSPHFKNPHAALPCSQTVLEGDLVSLGVTGPAAALALGLLYLQTNDAGAAAAFHLPGGGPGGGGGGWG